MNQRPSPGRSTPRIQLSATRVDPRKSLRNHLIVCAAVAVGAGALLYRLIPDDIARSARRLTDSAPAASQGSSKSLDAAAQAAEWGSLFTPEPPEPDRPPGLAAIPVPDFPGAMAIWGAVGRSSAGRIYFGVSAVEWKGAKRGESLKELSARLFEFDPASRSIRDRGNVVEQLKRLGMHRHGEQQQKIHTKIVEGPDGALYFASGDEAGADFDGTHPKNPTWPSHLWRLRPGQSDWEHLLTVPEHLIAVARGGDRIFALGWHGHVLYSFDARTGKTDRVRVGSLLGHISRNFAADARGHAYVPRLKVDTGSGARMVSTLVEFDRDLKEVGETVLEHYLGEGPAQSHGITGVQPLADGSIAFLTHAGYLYQIIPNPDAPSDVVKLGWFYPTGSGHYVASLFTYDGVRHLYGMTHGEPREWVSFDLTTRKSRAAPLPGKVPVMGLAETSGEGPLSALAEAPLGSPYGCATRDDQGNFYFVGRIAYDPVLYQAGPADPAAPRVARSGGRAEPGASITPMAPAAGADARPTRPAIVKAPEDPKPPGQGDARRPDPGAEAELERLRREAQRRVAAKTPDVAQEPPAPASAPPAGAVAGPDAVLPDADAFPPSSPSLDGGQPAPATAPGLSKEDALRALEESWKRRSQFRKDLWAILDEQGDQAGPAIDALCDRYGRDVPPEAKRAAGILAKTPVTRSDLARRLTIFRASGVPEPTLLDDIMRLEKPAIGSRGGPRNLDEARVRAARALLAVPLPKKN